MTPNNIDCIPGQSKVKQVKSRPIVVNFHGETVTSDAGVSLIAELDRKRNFNECPPKAIFSKNQTQKCHSENY